MDKVGLRGEIAIEKFAKMADATRSGSAHQPKDRARSTASANYRQTAEYEAPRRAIDMISIRQGADRWNGLARIENNLTRFAGEVISERGEKQP
ncbi:MAG TPA: hypothetical protein VMT64_08220 [Candidatus Binataceae bacterium]|nr:hypothetical protein [Candidatus Binataceae bacterium]